MVSWKGLVVCQLALVAVYYAGYAQAEMCAGCPIEFDPASEADKGFEKALQLTLKSANSDHPVQLVSISRATKQLVNGVIYRFDVVATVPGNENKVQTCQVSYMWRPWVNKELELMNENCTSPDKARQKRQLLGGLKDVEQSEMNSVRELADYTIKTLDDIDADNSKQVVVEIVKAQKQLVNGIMYHLQLRIKTTKCLEDDATSNRCLEREVEPEKFCQVQVHRSWADKSPMNAKVVKSECEPMRHALGSVVPLDTNSDSVLKMAQLAVERFNMMTNCMNVAGLVGIVKASTQMVAGSNVYLTVEVGDTNCLKNSYTPETKCEVLPNNSDKRRLCDVVIWQKPWENSKKITDFHCWSSYNDQVVNEERQARLINPDHPYIQNVISFYLLQKDKTSGSDYRLGLNHVISSNQQHDDGVKTTIKMVVGPSTCRKGVLTDSLCKADTAEEVCEVVVQDLGKEFKIVSDKCEPKRTKRQVGAANQVDPSDKDIQKLARFSLTEMDKTSNSNYRLGLAKIIDAKRQVVSGIVTVIKMEVGDSSCKKGEQTNSPCNANKVDKICTVSIWEQDWLNKREVTSVSCKDVQRRGKRTLLGGWTDIDVNHKSLSAYSDFLAREITSRLNSERIKKIVKIISAKNQVVAGELTKLTVEIADTDCLATENKDLSQCNVELSNSQDHKICDVTIWEQPWLNKREISSFDCHDASVEVIRQRRELMPGGVLEADPSDPHVQQLIKFYLMHKDKSSNSVNRFGVNKIMSVSKQVVAGTKLTVKMAIGLSSCRKGVPTNDPCNAVMGEKVCEVVIWDRPWIKDGRTILSEKCEAERVKRQLKTGAPGNVAPADEEVRRLAGFALVEMDKTTNSDNKLGLVRIVSAKRQVVAGIKTIIKMEIGESSCKKGEQTNSLCNANRLEKICTVGIWEQSWLNKREIVSSYCEDAAAKTKRQVGGNQDLDVNDSRVMALKPLVAQHVSLQANSIYTKGILKVLKASVQVVEGTLTKMTVEVSDTDCLKTANKDPSLCNIVPKNNGYHEICEVSVWEKPWQNFKKVTESVCRNVRSNELNSRPKRDVITGGVSPSNPNDPEVKELMGFYLLQKDKSSNSEYRVGVKEIFSVKKQVVAGVKVMIKMAVGMTTCRKDVPSNEPCKAETADNVCEVVIWDRPWIKDGRVILSEKCEPKRLRRQLGAPSNVSPSDKNVQTLVRFALTEMDKTTNSNNKLGLVRIISANSQVVAGTITTIRMEIGESSCKKGVPTNRPCNGNRVEKTCKISILEQPWLNKREILSSTCQSRPKRDLPGGITEVNVNDPSVVALKDFAGREITSRANSDNVKVVYKVLKAYTQVVSGMMMRLTVEVADTNCLKTDNKDPSQCNPLSNNTEDHQICEISILEQPWLNRKEMTSSECHNARPKRAVDEATTPPPSGAPVAVDPNTPTVHKLAKFALAELDKKTVSNFKLGVHHIVGATSQISSGFKYTIKMAVGDSSCPKGMEDDGSCDAEKADKMCTIVIWNWYWSNTHEVQSTICKALKSKRSPGLQNLDTEDPVYPQFAQFLRAYNKTYANETELMRRFLIFKGNMRKIEYLQRTEQGTGVYGPTIFADLTREEFKKHYLGLRPPKEGYMRPKPIARIPDVQLPVEFDWREHKAVTEIKNQGLCGSCWAFSVIGNIEGQWAIKNKQLLSLSEQELVDCDKYDSGCNGGWFDSAFRAIEELGGVETEMDYPYDGDKETCRFNSSEARVKISSSVNISSDETDMAKWLYTNGPITVAINANAMQFYIGGVSHPLKFLCNPSIDALDHGVLIVGYGVHNYPIYHKTLPYWIVKNSWGENWGLQGYYLVYRGDGTCGINQVPTSAVL